MVYAAKKFEWRKKEGEDWHELNVNLESLNLDQSLKAQEMFDNQNNQHLQEKFNIMIIILTAFIALGGILEFGILASDKFDFDSTILFWAFGFAFLIAGSLFLYISIPFNRVNKNKARDVAKNPFSLWFILDLFVRIMTMLAVVTVLAKSTQGMWLSIFIVLFILWAFRPLYLALKELKQR